MITYFYVNQKLNVMKSTTAILLLILMMALLNSLMSCTISKRTVYVPKNTFDTTSAIRHNSNRIFTLTKNY